MTKHLLHHDRNNQSWLRKWSLTQLWLNNYHKLNHIFRLVLCWFEGSQSGNDDNVILDMARHHLPTDFLVFWHWQIQPCACILNLPREENTQSSGIGTKIFNCPSPRIWLKAQENQCKGSHWNSTSDRPNILPTLQQDKFGHGLYSMTKHLPQATPGNMPGTQHLCKEMRIHSEQDFTRKNWKCSYPAWQGEDPMISHQVYFETKVCSLCLMPSPIHLSFIEGHSQEWQRK